MGDRLEGGHQTRTLVAALAAQRLRGGSFVGRPSLVAGTAGSEEVVLPNFQQFNLDKPLSLDAYELRGSCLIYRAGYSW